jgi:hypothetical protein
MSKKKPREKDAPDESNRRQFLGTIGGAAAATIAASTVVGAKSSTASPQDSSICEVGTVTGACAISVNKMAAEGRTVRVIGRIRDGKVIFDQANLEQFARAYPQADMAFVAVNAPFDPMPHACNN